MSWLGENPLPDHPVRVACLPGQSARYVTERNYLVLERKDDTWHAWWELEGSGATRALQL